MWVAFPVRILAGEQEYSLLSKIVSLKGLLASP